MRPKRSRAERKAIERLNRGAYGYPEAARVRRVRAASIVARVGIAILAGVALAVFLVGGPR